MPSSLWPSFALLSDPWLPSKTRPFTRPQCPPSWLLRIHLHRALTIPHWTLCMATWLVAAVAVVHNFKGISISWMLAQLVLQYCYIFHRCAVLLVQLSLILGGAACYIKSFQCAGPKLKMAAEHSGLTLTLVTLCQASAFLRLGRLHLS